jgi:predicted amidohydrolase
LRLGILQTTSGIDPAANAATLTDGAAASAADGAQILFTPEMTGLLDRDRARMLAHVTDEDGDPTLAAARAAAARHGMWIHLGSCPVRGGADGKLRNRGWLIDDTGAIRARYDKMHLFDVDLPTGERHRESAAYAAGDGAVVAHTPWTRLGLSICYDLRFPGLYAALSGAGAELLSVPAAFTRPTGAAHWHLLLRARAVENACFVVAAAQTGLHVDGRATYGHSLVVSPWGEVRLDMGEAAGHQVIEIDLAEVAEARGRIPVLAHRRDVSVGVMGEA